MIEQAAHQRQGPDHLLALREHVAIAGARIVPLEPHQVAEEDEDALQRLEHQPLEGARRARRRQVERAQAQQLAARLLLALPADGGSARR